MTAQTFTAAPVLGVSAAIFQDDQVLLVKRGAGAYAGRWSLPGGKVEPGERLLDAVHREVLEETGIACRISGVADVVEVIMATGEAVDATARHTVIVVFAGECAGGGEGEREGTLRMLQPGDDAVAAAWVSLNDLETFYTTPQLDQSIEKALHFLRGALAMQ